MNECDPIIETWYMNTDTGQLFEVIAIDADSGDIEIQYFDGSIEALDDESWAELPLSPTPAPEDWSGPFDEIEMSDMDSAVDASKSDVQQNPLDMDNKDLYD